MGHPPVYVLTDIQTCRDKHADRQEDRQAGRKKGRQTGGLAGSLTGGQPKRRAEW